jgi:hypothetical protein
MNTDVIDNTKEYLLTYVQYWLNNWSVNESRARHAQHEAMTGLKINKDASNRIVDEVLQTAIANAPNVYEQIADWHLPNLIRTYELALDDLRAYNKELTRARRKGTPVIDFMLPGWRAWTSNKPTADQPVANASPTPVNVYVSPTPVTVQAEVKVPANRSIQFARDRSGKIVSAETRAA